MRVISQKGMPVIIVFPYESIAVSQSYKEPNNIIGFDLKAKDDDVFYLATYSTPEKAEKAMQLLHEAYTGAPFIMKNAEVPEGFAEQLKNMRSGCITVVDHGDNVKIEPMNIVFRFPSEDEI